MVGMRLVRSSTPLSKEMIAKFWEYDHESIEQDVSFRLREGRGATGIPVPELIEDLRRRR
jgi:hypothetical protein